MATTTELAAKIGTIAEWHRDGINFHVRIVDGRMSYGNPEYKIEPLAGTGARWVRADSLKPLA